MSSGPDVPRPCTRVWGSKQLVSLCVGSSSTVHGHQARPVERPVGARPAPRPLERDGPTAAGAEVRVPPGGCSPRSRRDFKVTWLGDPGAGRLLLGLPLNTGSPVHFT